jgi:hypothetical protein
MNVFVDAFLILFPRKQIKRNYNRDRLGRFSIKNMPFRTYQDMRREIGYAE